MRGVSYTKTNSKKTHLGKSCWGGGGGFVDLKQNITECNSLQFVCVFVIIQLDHHYWNSFRVCNINKLEYKQVPRPAYCP